MNMPKTPFAMCLSGSAKETELRIRNIFQWKKKRPPVIALIAAVLVVVFCGSLIGFSNTPRNGTLGEVYQAYFAENPTNMIDYENKEAAYPSLALESENFGTALEYVRSMELRSVLGQKKYIGDFNSRNGAVVLRSAAGQELWIDLYRAGYVVVSNEGAGRLDKGDDAKVYKVSESFDVEVFLSYLAAELSQEEHADTTQNSVPAPNTITVDLSQEPPLTEADFALAVPDFLTGEQRLLYRKARNLYEHIFGADTSAVEYNPIPVSVEYKTLERNGYTYIRSNGRYSDWNTFDAVVHSVFTDDFFQSKNTVPLYMEQDGDMYFLPAGRGCGYFYNDNFPDEFRLISQTDTAIEFVVIGHYSEVWPKEGESSEENEERLKREYEYTYEFPITMVLTQDGWRFDRFSSTLTDEVGPATGSAMPEEEDEPDEENMMNTPVTELSSEPTQPSVPMESAATPVVEQIPETTDPGWVLLTLSDGTQREGYSSPDDVDLEHAAKGGHRLIFHVSAEEMEWASSVKFQKATVRFGGSNWEHPGDLFFNTDLQALLFVPTSSDSRAYTHYNNEILQFYAQANG